MRTAIIGPSHSFAIANGVGVVVPIDRELKEKEVANLLKRAEVSAVIYSKKMKKVMDEVLEDRGVEKDFNLSYTDGLER